MRLVTFAPSTAVAGRRPRSGFLFGDRVVDIDLVAAAHDGSATADRVCTVRTLIADPDLANRLYEQATEALGVEGVAGLVHHLDNVTLYPPVPDPDKIICLGLNYTDHALEGGTVAPDTPMFFAKFRNSLIGSRAEIVVPAVTAEPDYEAELAIVIARVCSEVSEKDALSMVAGVMPFNDVSARDLQLATSQWTAGKAIDTFAPCGPALVSLDEIDDIQDLDISARLNGQVVQNENTSAMIFSVAEIIAFVSRTITLVPGDVIATGTPAGVGAKRTPPRFLQDADLIEVEVGGVGCLSNRVVIAAQHAAQPEEEHAA